MIELIRLAAQLKILNVLSDTYWFFYLFYSGDTNRECYLK